ncbi:MAG: hypothetical protein QN177_06865 [Armatimonadota bacterium]|nr:hypothetical protein [Armatimonadota bacterium]MDR7431657.1 hypothetical protein [Armatimonadota bacterium]MDR7476431.1 hypothetical protein [Armatimonadota bacterium]MDR7525153.1 hypothetical protein [Armatimonadota bacterium]MDR7566036.1 hypothetical protein [Armatimonadota bacterium]
MSAVIRRYRFDPTSSPEIRRQITQGFLPLLRQTPGFVAYYWLDTGDGVGASLSVFESQAGAEESVRLPADYVQQHLAGLLGTPEVVQGEVKAHA